VPRDLYTRAAGISVRPLREIEGQVLELALEVGLYAQEFEPEHLGVHDERIGPAVPDVDRLVDEVVGLGVHGLGMAAEVAAETNYLRRPNGKPQVDRRARRASIPRSPP